MTHQKKKNTHELPADKIPSGLSSGEFLKYYASHKSAFQLEDKPSRRGRRTSEIRTEPKETPPPAPEKREGKKGNVGSEPGNRGKAVGLRIIGGKFKAVHLEYGGDHRVRPMKDRIRESVFNLMGTMAEGRHVVDLFSGTGALAFEALSRGARSATLIEVHFPTSRIVRRNIAALEEKEPGISDRIDLTVTDVFFWGKELAEQNEAKKRGETVSTAHLRHPLPSDLPWLVFCSPPYDFYVKREPEMLELLGALREAAPAGSVFVIESDDRFQFDHLGVEIPEKKRRSYPPAEIGIFTT